jgi:glutathione S-transferase
MLDQFAYTALVSALALFVYIWVILKVGGARAKYGVKAPAMDGPPEFLRVFRVQQNTTEQLVLFLPSLWLFAFAWGDLGAGVIGLVWPIGRVIYALGYYKAPEKRSAGFGLSFLPSAILLIGGTVGAVMTLF